MNKTIEVSSCCKADLVEDFRDNPRDHHDPIEIYSCSKCKRECEAEEQATCPLDICDGSGKYEEMEYECNDSTGYNTLVSGTGRMLTCPCSVDNEPNDQD
jgi:hypothetical protein